MNLANQPTMSISTSRSSLHARACVVLLAVVACIGADVAAAREGPARRGAPRMAFDRGARQAERAQQRAMQRQAQERPAVVVPPPVQPVIQPPPDRAKPGRLTPDERRALRQQINEAGREIYRPERP